MADEDFAVLVAELAASNAPIVAVNVPGKVTLRAAIANIYWKATSVLGLLGRPRDPRQGDDQFGHVLSIHAEVLINQAVLQAIAAQTPGVDFDGIRANVLRSLSS